MLKMAKGKQRVRPRQTYLSENEQYANEPGLGTRVLYLVSRVFGLRLGLGLGLGLGLDLGSSKQASKGAIPWAVWRPGMAKRKTSNTNSTSSGSGSGISVSGFSRRLIALKKGCFFMSCANGMPAPAPFIFVFAFLLFLYVSGSHSRVFAL